MKIVVDRETATFVCASNDFYQVSYDKVEKKYKKVSSFEKSECWYDANTNTYYPTPTNSLRVYDYYGEVPEDVGPKYCFDETGFRLSEQYLTENKVDEEQVKAQEAENRYRESIYDVVEQLVITVAELQEKIGE